jgi:hypothetical protein
VLIGLQAYPADAETARRQRRAASALLGLAGVEAVNLQFRHGPQVAVYGMDCAAVLVRDSLAQTGAPGLRKPMAPEIFDVLADLAARRGHRYFAYINADIVVTPAAVTAVRDLARETYAVSRGDVDAVLSAPARVAPPDATIMTAGQDMFVVEVEWWRRNRSRFRPYVVGEALWDNVYTAIMMCHSNGLLLNREPLVLHERHPAGWHDESPSARYNGMLAALDSRYFSLWSQYWQRLTAARERGSGAAEEDALRAEAFAWRPSVAAAARQALRSVRARARYRRLRAGERSLGTHP